MIAGAMTGLPGCECVARGARVRTPSGLRRIEELAVGDRVLSLDPSTGATIAGAITAVRSATRETVLLRAVGTELCVTSDHPVYSPRDASWAPAGDWVVGRRDRLVRLAGEGPVVVAVTSCSTYAGVREVFDLTVDTPLHNFVAEGILVHNKSVGTDAGPQCWYQGRWVLPGDVCDCGVVTGALECDGGGFGVCVCPTIDAGR